jgi:hypothetical protein
MKSALNVFVIMIMIFALTIVTGCYTPPYSPIKDQFFHGKKPEFKPGPEGGADLVEITEGVDFAKYKMIILDPPIFKFTSTAEYNAIPGNALSNLRKDFRRAFSDALGDAYPLVDIPNQNAMRLRFLITGVSPSIPQSSKNNTQWKYLSLGGASMKAELLDSLTYERVAAVIDRKTGDQLPAVQSRDEWVHTKEAFNYWAKRLRRWLDMMNSR